MTKPPKTMERPVVSKTWTVKNSPHQTEIVFANHFVPRLPILENTMLSTEVSSIDRNRLNPPQNGTPAMR
jgi:hypothetical protein